MGFANNCSNWGRTQKCATKRQSCLSWWESHENVIDHFDSFSFWAEDWQRTPNALGTKYLRTLHLLFPCADIVWPKDRYVFQKILALKIHGSDVLVAIYFSPVFNLSLCKASPLPLPLLGWWGGCPESSERSVCWVSRPIGFISPQKNIIFLGCYCILCACRLQKQMKIMNRNLTGKLEEMNGMQNVDTHVALSGDFQLLALRKKVLKLLKNCSKLLLPRNTWSAAWAHQKVGSLENDNPNDDDDGCIQT